MIAAPRLATVGMKVSRSHASSLTTSAAPCRRPRRGTGPGTASASGCPRSSCGVIVGRPATCSLAASWEIARLWSRRVIAVKRSAGTSGACDRAISALVLAGLPTTRTRMSSAAPALIASPCGLKMPPLASSRSPRSMPSVAGPGADEQRDVGAVERRTRVVGDVDAAQQRERAVVELHRGALGGPHGRRDLQQAQLDRRVRAEQLTRGDAEEQRVADLAGRAGDGDIHHRLGHAKNLLVARL